MRAQARKKENPIAKVMKNIVLLLPTYTTTTIGQQEVYATIVILLVYKKLLLQSQYQLHGRKMLLHYYQLV
jgi:hypothetical protein